jgi:hypothetical protein
VSECPILTPEEPLRSVPPFEFEPEGAQKVPGSTVAVNVVEEGTVATW